jgi:transcriptional regulator with GAF, ATPase, and Fis domain
MTKVWYHFFGQGKSHGSDAIITALASTQLEPDVLSSSELALGAGILFFAENSPALGNFVRKVSCDGRERVLIVATSRAALNGNAAWSLLKAGASDVMVWDEVLHPAKHIAARFERWVMVDQLVASPVVRSNLVGESRAWKTLLRHAVEAARFTDASVLVLGESGVGKELVARLMHTLDARPRKRDLVVVDCTTIVPELSGSEFFGHERGALTGAVASRDGAFALADGGTLFLDEVGELPLPLQAQLLRVIQEGSYKRVGGNTWQQTHFRLVAATNKDLQEAVARRAFRRDLYYRLAGVTLCLPPLRERLEDILPLTQHFMQRLRPESSPLALDDLVQEYLLIRSYPGNVRDLKQLVTQIVYRHVGPGPVTLGSLPEEEQKSLDADRGAAHASFATPIRQALTRGIGLKEISRIVTEEAIRVVLREEDGNLQRAARRLGVTDRALQMRRALRRDNDGENEFNVLEASSVPHAESA